MVKPIKKGPSILVLGTVLASLTAAAIPAVVASAIISPAMARGGGDGGGRGGDDSGGRGGRGGDDHGGGRSSDDSGGRGGRGGDDNGGRSGGVATIVEAVAAGRRYAKRRQRPRQRTRRRRQREPRRGRRRAVTRTGPRTTRGPALRTSTRPAPGPGAPMICLRCAEPAPAERMSPGSQRRQWRPPRIATRASSPATTAGSTADNDGVRRLEKGIGSGWKFPPGPMRHAVGTQNRHFTWPGRDRCGTVPAGSPPLARITFREPSLSSSQVIRTREKPSARQTGRIMRSAWVA